MTISVTILAAGQGSRMRSALPKVLHPLANRPMLTWVINAAEQINPDVVVVVYGHGGEQVKEQLAGHNISWVLQSEQLGTGHAVQQAIPQIINSQQVLVLYGDTPLISPITLQQLITTTSEDGVGIITAKFSDPTGLGRIIRDNNNKVSAIVEEKDATIAQKKINEINTGIMLLPVKKLTQWLSQLENDNAQSEFYLTDIIKMAVSDGVSITTVTPKANAEVAGVNTRQQLIELERSYCLTQAAQLLAEGVTIRDPARFDLRGELHAAQDVTIDINVIIEGKVTLGKNVKIGPNVILKEVTIGDNTEIFANSMLEESTVGENCLIGPFARLRPGTKLANDVKVGNFVETKKAIVADGSKIPHLSYIGDAVVGKNVNIGAGVITANYDGVNKHQTTIEDNVFIGCDTQLIAPVTIGKSAYIGCGSSINKDAPANKLTLARSRQKTIEGWEPPKKGA
jgi:bifunctional UDP-N-acetylglucosamine pyrophosphorylase/glucosamine-1-phosphate N-acetyltransferase